MPKPGFQRVEELFHQAVTLDASERTAYLDVECAGDSDLRHAVENLLRHDADTLAPSDQFLVSPIAQDVGELRGDATMPSRRNGRRIEPTEREWPVLPGYQILGILGSGGMGVVYKAKHLGLNRVVALKMLLPSVLDGPEQLGRFRAEAELLARLQHPHIIPVYDIGEHDGRPYFTMEFIVGPNLAEAIAGKPLDPRDSARVIETLARAIEAVHNAGVIHRDLKPANVLLQPEQLHGQSVLQTAIPKITDFGVAKDQSSNRGLSQTGLTLGTPGYMAPEQARNRANDVGPAADTYALGAILYEMLTGRPPFEAGSPVETIAQVLTEEPVSPSRLRPSLPRDIVTICLKCLEKSPSQRYESALGLAEDLRRFSAGEPILARPIGPVETAVRWSHRHPLAATLAAVSALLFVALITAVLLYNSRLKAALELASELSAQQRQQLVQLNINVGLKHWEDGDNFTAILRYSEALRLDDGQTAELRSRVAAALGECPSLKQLRELNRTVLCARAVGPELRAVTVNDDGSLVVRDVLNDRQIGPELKFDSRAERGMISADGHWLTTVDAAGAKRTIRIVDGHKAEWPSSTGTNEERGWRIVSDANGLSRLVDGKSGTTLATLQLPPDDSGAKITLVRLGPGGKRVLLGDSLDRVRVWDVASGKPVSPLLPHNGPIVAAEFGESLDDVVVICRAGSVRVWRLAGKKHRIEPGNSIESIVVLCRVLANNRINERQELTPLSAEHLTAHVARVNASMLP